METPVEPLNKRNENCVQVDANMHFQTSIVYASYNFKFTQAEIAKQNYLFFSINIVYCYGKATKSPLSPREIRSKNNQALFPMVKQLLI